MRFFNTAIRKKDVFMAFLFYRGSALADPFFYSHFFFLKYHMSQTTMATLTRITAG